MTRIARLTAFFLLFCSPVASLAQGSQVAFGNTQQDSSLPVEVTAETLDVNQNDNTAIFTGNVIIGQGEMRLSAPRVLVVYKDDQSGIKRLEARGGVTIVSGQDAAEGREADYDVDNGMIELRGDVLLVQGPQALTSDKMVVDTRAGTARMTGQVKTVLQPEGE